MCVMVLDGTYHTDYNSENWTKFAVYSNIFVIHGVGSSLLKCNS